MIELYLYKIPFKRSLVLGNQVIDHREGIIVHYSVDDLSLWSEIAPLPGFSSEKLDDVKEILQHIQHDLDALLNKASEDLWYSWIESSKLPPSCRFGLDMLFQSLKASRMGISLHQSMNPMAGNRVGCNALVGILSDDEYTSAVDRIIKDGFRTIKFKIKDPTNLVKVLKPYRETHPEIHFRFDANGSWPLEQGFEWATLLSELSPQYLEQPFPVGQERAMADLQSRIGFPLAADESCKDLDSVQYLHALRAAQTFILKPALIGSLREIKSLIDWLKDHHYPFTITTLLESGISRKLITSICAAWANPNIDHGLNTGTLFTQDLLIDEASDDPSQILVDDIAGFLAPNQTLIHRL
jgi:o-succinylbenzoate synthase